jgi:hypothetical protein
MKIRLIVSACAAVAIGFAFTVSTPAQAQDAKACGKQWSAMTKDQKKGLKKKDYVADCVAKAKTTAPMTAPSAAPKTGTATTPGATGKPGRAAMVERERACGKEWREQKAAGRIPAGQKWPQYWSECNKRMKAKGM